MKSARDGVAMKALTRMGLLSFLAFVGGCMAQPVEEARDAPEADAPTQEAREQLPIVSYDPKDFPFVTIIRDDGRGDGGGWQEAKANLSFWQEVYPHLPRHWRCSLIVGMPIRTVAAGTVPPSHAAKLSVQIAEDTARAMEADYDLPPGIFCAKFVSNMDLLFKSRYQRLGAAVRRGG